jgi:hypothetical protein
MSWFPGSEKIVGLTSFLPYDIQLNMSNDRAYHKFPVNEDPQQMQACVEFPSGNTVGTLLVANTGLKNTCISYIRNQSTLQFHWATRYILPFQVTR